jgi:hypothetical protein
MILDLTRDGAMERRPRHRRRRRRLGVRPRSRRRIRSPKASTRFSLAVGLGRLPDAQLLEPLIDPASAAASPGAPPKAGRCTTFCSPAITQAQAAASLGVTPQAVSLRAQSARLRTESAAQAALVRLLDAAGAPPEVG